MVWASTSGHALSQVAQGGVDVVLVDERTDAADPLAAFQPCLSAHHPPVLLLSESPTLPRLVEAYQRGIHYGVVKPFHPRELLSCLYAALHRQRRVVCLGGGTGLYTLLLGLKTLPSAHLTSIVSMSDDGGSSGRIRQAYGVLPPGDVRRSLVALSTAPGLMNDLIQYRFREGAGLTDHNLGNLLLTAMANLTGSMAEAVRAMGDILNVQGIVLPVTTTPNTLVAELEDGSWVRGESHIDVPTGRDPQRRIVRLWQEPQAEANPDALSAMLAADLITIGPGDLFTSIIANLCVKGVAHAIRASRARTLYLCNLMTKPGETSGFTVADHVREVVRYLGEDLLDEVLVSNTVFSPEALADYANKGQEPVRLDKEAVLQQATNAQIIVRDLASERELVRHDSLKLVNEIFRRMALSSAPSPAHAAGH
ncbi:MAG: uridine diphosphate-N-acetylglucosamine-binding protein YvcK [Candidatus Omnitrophica bacterium]|nr:uridine diphosphate-N-acetylglucosamine-binding protein YvcK [Candidatus Omnitrophota bacterium]